MKIDNFPNPKKEKNDWPWTTDIPIFPPTMSDGKNWPKISIITPSYNQGQFIEETIRSVLLQGYPNLQYVIIDGGSTDNTVEIIKKYEHLLTYWISEPDNGQVDAINKGLKQCSGEWVNWLNSDDLLEEDSLKKLAEIIINIEENIKVIACSITYVDTHGKIVKDRIDPRIPKSVNSFFTLDQNKCPVLNQPSTFIKKEYFKLTDLTYVMDWVLYMNISDLYPDSYYSEDVILSKFRVHNENKSSFGSEIFHYEAVEYIDNFKSKYGVSKTRILIEKWKRYSLRRISFINSKKEVNSLKRLKNIFFTILKYPDLLLDSIFLESVYNQIKKLIIQKQKMETRLVNTIKNKSDITFIQIGANDGENYDFMNTLLRENESWSGVFVEPIPYLFEKLVSLNSKYSDKYYFENAAINDTDTEKYKRIFYISKNIEELSGINLPYWYDQIASFSKNHVLNELKTVIEEDIVNKHILEKDVKCITLRKLIEKYNISRIDLLVIDVEGYDYHVLKQVEYIKIKPSIIVYEYKHLNLNEYHLSIELLKKLNYKHYIYDQDILAIKMDS